MKQSVENMGETNETQTQPSYLSRVQIPQWGLITYVRRHSNWNNQQPDLKEDLAHLVQYIKRRICGIASAGSPLSSV